LPPAFMLVSCSAFSSILKMEAICSSQTLVYFQWTTWHYIPEDWAQLSRFYLKTETESSLQNVVFCNINITEFLDKDRMMDNVQKRNICTTLFICKILFGTLNESSLRQRLVLLSITVKGIALLLLGVRYGKVVPVLNKLSTMP
jgi:hypothetical protein